MFRGRAPPAATTGVRLQKVAPAFYTESFPAPFPCADTVTGQQKQLAWGVETVGMVDKTISHMPHVVANRMLQALMAYTKMTSNASRAAR